MHCWALHKHRCQFSSVSDEGRDFFCRVRISSYEAAGELGSFVREEEVQQKVEEKKKVEAHCFLNVRVAWHETKELLWLTVL